MRVNKQKWLVVAILPVVLVSGCQRREAAAVSAAEAPPVQATVISVEPEPFAVAVAVTGTLVSTSRVEVKAETIGRVVRFDKQEGAAVAAGEPLVWLEEENYRLALRQAESGVEVAAAALEKARVMEAHSRSELERAQNLLQSGGITDKDLKAAATAEQDARAQVELADAQLAQARVAVELARKKLRDCRIVAPVAGEIQKRFVNPGAYVEAPTALFTLVDNRKLELESAVASAELAPIRPGQKVSFTVNSYPARFFEGRVVDISPAVDDETRSAKVRVDVDNRSGKLRAGMFVQGEILTGVQAQSLVIPASAIYREDHSAKESFVFLVENGKAVRRAVRIGEERDGKLRIVAGLHPGDVLITGQSVELADGVRVEPRNIGTQSKGR